MKTFKQFQEDMSKLPGLGGGGGGTNAITDKAKGKKFKTRVGDVGRILTRPFRKVKNDPTEKFATEGVMAIPAAAGVISKVLPAAAATVGAVGTMMQARKSGKFTRKVMKGKVGNTQKVKPELLDAVRKKQAETKLKKEKGSNTSPDLMDAMKQKQAEVDKIRKKKGRIQGVNMSPTKNRVTDKIDAGVFKRGKIIEKETRKRMNAPENQFNSYNPLEEVAIANSLGGGQIAGTVEAGDDPPVNKKKKRLEPKFMARGKLPGARTRFKAGVDLLASFKKNK